MKILFHNTLHNIGNDPNKEENTNFDVLKNFDPLDKNQLKVKNYGLDLGWSLEKSQQFVESSTTESVNKLEYINLKKGEKLYAFCHADGTRPGRDNRSPFYMTQDTFNKISSNKEFYNNCKWNLFNLKDEFALPCSNSCNTIVTREILEDHQGVETGIAGATEEFRLIESLRNDDAIYQRSMAGGSRRKQADTGR